MNDELLTRMVTDKQRWEGRKGEDFWRGRFDFGAVYMIESVALVLETRRNDNPESFRGHEAC